MSRIGKQPIEIPSGVTVSLSGNTVTVKGAKETLTLDIRDEVKFAVEGTVANVTRVDDSRTARALHGLTRSLIANMIIGVTTGFEKNLEIVGVGYKAELKGDVLNMILGYSHNIPYKLPKGITAKVDKNTEVKISGADKQVVGQVAAELRSLRPPEPYKGKGVKYQGEHIKRKAGKAGKAGA